MPTGADDDIGARLYSGLLISLRLTTMLLSQSTLFRSALLSVLLLCSGALSAATDCASEPLQARYSISTRHGDHTTTRALELLRYQGLVAHHFADRHITEVWERNATKQARVTRHFDTAQRGIEYASNEIGGAENDDDWSSKVQLISNSRLSSMTLTGSQGSGCKRVEHYHQQQGERSISLVWRPEQRLIQSLTIEQGDHREHWQLEQQHRSLSDIAAFFEQRMDYQTTDYADIGDNESDPFLLKMIRLGFIKGGASGMYDAEGHALSGGHQH